MKMHGCLFILFLCYISYKYLLPIYQLFGKLHIFYSISISLFVLSREAPCCLPERGSSIALGAGWTLRPSQMLWLPVPPHFFTSRGTAFRRATPCCKIKSGQNFFLHSLSLPFLISLVPWLKSSSEVSECRGSWQNWPVLVAHSMCRQ